MKRILNGIETNKTNPCYGYGIDYDPFEKEITVEYYIDTNVVSE